MRVRQPVAGDTALLRTTRSPNSPPFQPGPPTGSGWRKSALPDPQLTTTGISWPASTSRSAPCVLSTGVRRRTAMVERIPNARSSAIAGNLSADEVCGFSRRVAEPEASYRLDGPPMLPGFGSESSVRLKLPDIDSGRMLIRVEQGKGGRGPLQHLSPQLLGVAARLLAENTARTLAVSGPGREPAGSIRSGCRGTCRNGAAAAKLGKPVTVHYPAPRLRTICSKPHTDIRIIRGAAAAIAILSTTARYTQVAATTIGSTTSSVRWLKLEEAGPA